MSRTTHPYCLPTKDRDIVFYCESAGCYRSCRAADAAIKAGYKQVYILQDGIPAWKQAGYAMETIERIPRGSIQSVRAQSLKQMLTERKDILLVDVRSEKSYKEGHIEGALNIPLYRFSSRYAEIPLDRTVVLVDDRGLPDVPGGELPGDEGLQGHEALRRHAGLAGNEGSEVTGNSPEPNGWNR